MIGVIVVFVFFVMLLPLMVFMFSKMLMRFGISVLLMIVWFIHFALFKF